MPLRPWIALLLLINYLLVAEMGCMSRPEDPSDFLLIKTTVAGQYQECRYLRMDGLSELLNEALASRYQRAPDTAKQQFITVVHGIDTHHLPCLTEWVTVTLCWVTDTLPTTLRPATSAGTGRPVYSPPRLG